MTAPTPAAPRHLVVMGVSGSGKSTVGAAVAAQLGLPFAEGDDFHPPANRQKMADGIALTDEDRWPWLRDLAGWMTGHAATGSVVSCSALRHTYRDVLRTATGLVVFAYLDLPEQVLHDRVAGRAGHYMPVSLLRSQLDTLEPLGPGEGFTVDGTAPVDAVVRAVLDRLAEQVRGPTTPELGRRRRPTASWLSGPGI